MPENEFSMGKQIPCYVQHWGVSKKREKRKEEEVRQVGEVGYTSELAPRTDGSWKRPEKRVRRANSERGVLTRFLRAYASDSHSRSRDVLELVPRVSSSSWCMNKFSDSTIGLTRDYPDRKSFQRRIYSRRYRLEEVSVKFLQRAHNIWEISDDDNIRVCFRYKKQHAKYTDVKRTADQREGIAKQRSELSTRQQLNDKLNS